MQGIFVPYGADAPCTQQIFVTPAFTGDLGPDGALRMSQAGSLGGAVLSARLEQLPGPDAGTLVYTGPNCGGKPQAVEMVRVGSYTGSFAGAVMSSGGQELQVQFQIAESARPDANGSFSVLGLVTVEQNGCSAATRMGGGVFGTHMAAATSVPAGGATGLTAEGSLDGGTLTFFDGDMFLPPSMCGGGSFSGVLTRQ